MTTPSPFSFDYYRHIIRSYKEAGFKITSFPNYSDQPEKTLIMRHDVDYTLNGVRELAEIEADEGVTASYLFRIHASDYNFYSHHTHLLAEHIHNLGHDVGLHFEAGTYAQALDKDAPTVLKQEKAVIEMMLDREIQTASEHRDVSCVIHGTLPYHAMHDPYDAGFKFYAMDPAYCQDMKYISDSNANWREGDPLDHLGRHQRMQILIHPDWWYSQHLLLKGPYVHGLGN